MRLNLYKLKNYY